MSAMSQTVHVALLARDGLFLKDGRGWQTSASGRGHGLDWPWPSTLLGALRAAWGRTEETVSGAVFDRRAWPERTASVRLGHTLGLHRPLPRSAGAWTAADRVWPAPQDAVWLEGRTQLERLDPVPAPCLRTLGRDEDEARESLWWPSLDDAAKPLGGPRWWAEERFGAWLAGGAVPAETSARSLGPAQRLQAHVGIGDESLAADEGVLFSHDVIETLERDAEWAIGVEMVVPAGDPPAILTLGSDRRLVHSEPLPQSVFEPPAAVLEAFRGGSTGLRLFVVTPAHFARGWLPDGLEAVGNLFRGHLAEIQGELVLRAAIVPRPGHVSGWDMAAGRPKPTDRLVLPGAVYFFERADGRSFAEGDARTAWLAALGRRTEEGFGRVVPGVWNARGNQP